MLYTPHALYIIKDSYFDTFPSANWMWNKRESRPHYFAVQDKTGLFWMIPLSSQVDNYRAKIERIEQKRGAGQCLYYHIGKIHGVYRVFIISGMFPVTPEYISHPYTFSGKPYIVEDAKLNRAVRSKAMSYLRLLEQRQMRDQNSVLKIRAALAGPGK